MTEIKKIGAEEIVVLTALNTVKMTVLESQDEYEAHGTQILTKNDDVKKLAVLGKILLSLPGALEAQPELRNLLVKITMDEAIKMGESLDPSEFEDKNNEDQEYVSAKNHTDLMFG